MSDNHPDQAFWQRVDAIINLSNDQCDPVDPEAVGASTMFASARFNAFIVARTTGSAENMALEKARAIEYFTEQYRKMIEDNLDDFARNFGDYMKPAAPR